MPLGFVVPAQPVEREAPLSGADWVHEIKHDGYRMLVRRDGEAVVIGPDGLTDPVSMRPSNFGINPPPMPDRRSPGQY
jgi:hypothetical protein